MKIEHKKTIQYIKLLIGEIETKREQIRTIKDDMKELQGQIERIQDAIFNEYLENKHELTYYRIRRELGNDLEYKFVNIYRKFNKEN
jgi:predicted transcriptional regulator